MTRQRVAAGYGGRYLMEQDVMLRAEPAEGEGPRNDVARSLGYLQRALTEVTL
jgi:inosose dehydratase